MPVQFLRTAWLDRSPRADLLLLLASLRALCVGSYCLLSSDPTPNVASTLQMPRHVDTARTFTPAPTVPLRPVELKVATAKHSRRRRLGIRLDLQLVGSLGAPRSVPPPVVVSHEINLFGESLGEPAARPGNRRCSPWLAFAVQPRSTLLAGASAVGKLSRVSDVRSRAGVRAVASSLSMRWGHGLFMRRLAPSPLYCI